MSSTQTEASVVSPETNGISPTNNGAHDTPNRTPEEEFEVETATDGHSAEDESQYPTGRKLQIILLSISLVLIASDVSMSIARTVHQSKLTCGG